MVLSDRASVVLYAVNILEQYDRKRDVRLGGRNFLRGALFLTPVNVARHRSAQAE